MSEARSGAVSPNRLDNVECPRTPTPLALQHTCRSPAGRASGIASFRLRRVVDGSIDTIRHVAARGPPDREVVRLGKPSHVKAGKPASDSIASNLLRWVRLGSKSGPLPNRCVAVIDGDVSQYRPNHRPSSFELVSRTSSQPYPASPSHTLAVGKSLQATSTSRGTPVPDCLGHAERSRLYPPTGRQCTRWLCRK